MCYSAARHHQKAQVANHVDHSYYFALHYSSFLAKCMARDVVRKTQVD